MDSTKRIIAVTGGKGGVGKTQVAINLATVFADRGEPTYLLDGDFGLANVDLVLGVSSRYSLYHVLFESKTIEDVAVECANGLRVVSGGSGIRKLAQLDQQQQYHLIKAFDDIYSSTKNLIIDTAAGLHESVCQLLSASNEIVIVITREITSIKDAYALIKVLSNHYQRHCFKIVVNMAKSQAEGQVSYRTLLRMANQFLDVNLQLIGVIEDDMYIKKAIIKQRPVTGIYPGAKSSKAFYALADEISKLEPATLNGGVSFFFEKLFPIPEGLQKQGTNG